MKLVKGILFVGVFFYFTMSFSVTYMGLTETGISKNTFTCPEGESAVCFLDKIKNSVGFDLSGGKTIQLFNSFGYWLKKEGERKQYIQDDLKYAGKAVEDQLRQEDWNGMGAYCVLVSTHPVLQEVVDPSVKAGAGQVKVVAQLLYNGNQIIQLWSQHALVLEKGDQFYIELSADEDTALSATISQPGKDATPVQIFVDKLGLQRNNRQDEYQKATNSPRTIRIKKGTTTQDTGVQITDDSAGETAARDILLAGA